MRMVKVSEDEIKAMICRRVETALVKRDVGIVLVTVNNPGIMYAHTASVSSMDKARVALQVLDKLSESELSSDVHEKLASAISSVKEVITVMHHEIKAEQPIEG